MNKNKYCSLINETHAIGSVG